MKSWYRFLLGAGVLFALSSSDAYAMSGTGTVSDPYLITNCNELQDMNLNLTASYKLANDIDCSSSVSWNSGSGFDPIGDYSQPFEGIFEGNSKFIHNLHINRPSENYVGLFGYNVNTVRNLTLDSPVIFGQDYTGSLSGYSDTSNNRNISVINGMIKGRNFTGGLIGMKISGELFNSYAYNTQVEGLKGVGGTAGYIVMGKIDSVYSTGNVKGSIEVGGVLGVYDFMSTMSNSYSHSRVEGTDKVGGLIGYFMPDSTLNQAYSTGQVTGSTNTGGLIGYQEPPLTISSSYWDRDTSFQSASALGTGKNTSEMKTQGTFSGWNFTTVWGISPSINGGYPYLRSVPAVPAAPPSPPGVPANLKLVKKSSTSIELSWDAVPSATNYIIKRDGVQIGSGAGTSFTDSGLTPATAYQYEIIAQNADGDSPPASLNVTTKVDDWVQISVGVKHVLGLKSDGSVWSWGSDDFGSLGSGVTSDVRYIPKRVMQNSTTPFGGAVQVEAGYDVSYAVKSDGSVWSWGKSDSLGTGTGSTAFPSRVRGIGGTGYLTGIVKISSNLNESVYALKSDGTLYAWGYNNGGTIGDGTTSGTKTYPVQVKDSSGTGFLANVTDVLSYGEYNTSTVVKLSDGSFLSWGNNNQQMLGYSNGNATEILPKPFPQLSGGNKLSGTYRHALVLKSDGTVVGFGNSQYRQLSPSVSYSSNACCIATYSLPSKDIAAGNDVTFVLKNDGKIIGIGFGSLGNGTHYPYPGSLNFVDVSTIDDAESIYSGTKGTYAIRSDGTLWGWGGFNSVGDGTRNSRLSPVKIGEVTAPTFASSSFTSSNLTSTSVRLNWTDNPDGTSFIIKRNGVVVYEGLPNCWSGCYINNSGLSGGTTYTYELIAKNEAGESPPMILVVNPPVTRSWNLTSPNPILNFGTVTVDDTVQVLTANLGVMPVSHQGANPDGWRVTVSAAPFSQINGGSLSLPVNTLKLNPIQSITQTSGSSLLPMAIAGSHVIDSGAVEIINAPAGSGEGDFSVAFSPDALELSIDTSRVIVDPLNNPTTYRSTITWSMSVGP